MDKYVEQLIEEILSKLKPKPDQAWEDIDIEEVLPENIEYSDEELEYQENKADEDLEKHFEEIELYLQSEGNPTLWELTGMTEEQFPEYFLLKKKHKLKIIHALKELFASYRVILDFPEKLPVDDKYVLSVDSLCHEHFDLTIGYHHKDFCSGDPQMCMLGKYCKCNNPNEDEFNLWDFPDQPNSEATDDDDELPF